MGRLSTAITTEVLSADPTVSALPDTAPSAVDAVVSAAGYVAPVFSALDALPEVVPSGLVPVASVFAVDSISAALLDDVDSISSDSVSSDGSDPVYYGPFVAPASVPRRIPWSPHASGRTYIELETLEDTTLSRYFQARTRSSRLAAAWTYVHLRVKQHNAGVPTRLFFVPRLYGQVRDYIIARTVGDFPLAPPTERQFLLLRLIASQLVGSTASRWHFNHSSSAA